MKISESELILNADKSIYHLALQPEDIADTIFVVGDPDRVALVSHYFDSIEIRKQKREFITHTGMLGKQRVSVISTGISTDNIDIVVNELDALANIDFDSRLVKKELKSLKIIRIGTSGGLQHDLPLGASVVSTYGVGLDGVANYYQLPNTATELGLRKAFIDHFDNNPIITNAYIATAASSLVKKLQNDCLPGITVTCAGFYGPQGRMLRAKPAIENFVETLQSFSYQEHTLTNFEMETAAIYAMGTLLGHECCSVNTIIANRATKQFVSDPYKAVDKTIQLVLGNVCG